MGPQQVTLGVILDPSRVLLQFQLLSLDLTPALVHLSMVLMEVHSKEGHPQIPVSLLPTWSLHLQVEEPGAAEGRRFPRCLRLKSSRRDSWPRNWPSGRKFRIIFKIKIHL